jgi:hypothetical protein
LPCARAACAAFNVDTESSSFVVVVVVVVCVVAGALGAVCVLAESSAFIPVDVTCEFTKEAKCSFFFVFQYFLFRNFQITNNTNE